MPKSTAPSEIRFAERPVSTSKEKAKSNEQGIVNAAIKEIRTSPRKTSNSSVTRVSPSSTTCRTVVVVKCTRSVRS